jgi:hypothetical protein
MRKGFALPLIIGLMLSISILAAVYLKFNKINNFSPSINNKVYTNPSSLVLNIPTPTTDPVPSNQKINCSKNQLGDIRFKPPLNWDRTSKNCFLFFTGDGEVYGYPANGARISINISSETMVTNKCESLYGETIKPIKCTSLKGNKLDIYREDYEGHYLVYSLTYKNKIYDFALGTNQESNYRPVLEQIINTVELL